MPSRSARKSWRFRTHLLRRRCAASFCKAFLPYGSYGLCIAFRVSKMDRGSGRGKLFSLRLSAADQAGCWAYRRQHQAAIGCRCQCVAAAKCQFHVAQASPNASQSPIDDTKSVAVTIAPAPPPCGRVLRCLALIVYHTDQLPVSTYMHSSD